MAPKKCAQIQMGNAVFDLERGVMIVPGDFTIHSTGNLKLKADQHIVIESGQNPEERPGYLNSIWLNPSYDDEGRPVQEPDVIEGEVVDERD